jgi:hypothetical protein
MLVKAFILEEVSTWPNDYQISPITHTLSARNAILLRPKQRSSAREGGAHLA